MKNFLKKLYIVLPTALFLAVYLSIPEEIVVPKGQNINLNFAMSAEANTEKTGNYDCNIKLFNVIPIKTVSLSVLPEHYVIPSGQAIGIKIHTDGVLVIDTGNVTDASGMISAPAKKAGIKRGDRIIEVNGEKTDTNFQLKCLINSCGGKTVLTVARNDQILKIPVNAVYSKENGIYQIGLWVKDSAAGIGTLTFYDPESSSFASLGHGICDCDTNCLLKAQYGTISPCKINKVIKSENGTPGELIGEFMGDDMGNVLLNCDVGIYGRCSYFPKSQAVPVASRFQITESDAEILCDIDGNGPKPYNIKITKIYKSPRASNKCFVFKVTDPTLIENAGGIVQGMSGSPILQDGKLIGAVTHVFVNDSTKGYGIFAENMLDITTQMK